jgi:hypothetical protein
MQTGFTIAIFFIPSHEQRYSTVGDWYYEGKRLIIKVSNDDPSYPTKVMQEAVALHELTEALLCAHAGVTQKQVDDFDFKWEAEHLNSDQSEPGDSPAAPYHRQHRVADIIEQVYVHEATSYNNLIETPKQDPRSIATVAKPRSVPGWLTLDYAIKDANKELPANTSFAVIQSPHTAHGVTYEWIAPKEAIPKEAIPLSEIAIYIGVTK